ncbi:hypothetical protein Tco_0698889 [Tanacetum coccineum]
MQEELLQFKLQEVWTLVEVPNGKWTIDHLIQRIHQLDAAYLTFCSGQCIDFADTAYQSSDTGLVLRIQFSVCLYVFSLMRAHPTDLLCLFLEDSNGKMIEKSLLEIEVTFLEKIRDNAFKGFDGENVFAHIDECIDTIATWEDLVEKFVQKFYHLFDHIEEEEDDEDYDPTLLTITNGASNVCETQEDQGREEVKEDPTP